MAFAASSFNLVPGYWCFWYSVPAKSRQLNRDTKTFIRLNQSLALRCRKMISVGLLLSGGWAWWKCLHSYDKIVRIHLSLSVDTKLLWQKSRSDNIAGPCKETVFNCVNLLQRNT